MEWLPGFEHFVIIGFPVSNRYQETLTDSG